MNTKISLEQTDHGAKIIVPKNFYSTESIVMPSIDTHKHWNILVKKNAHILLYEPDIRNSEIIIEENAQLDYIALQKEAYESGNSMKKKFILKNNAVVRVFTGIFNSTHVKMVGELQGNNTAFENHVIYFASGKEHMEIELNSEHSGHHTMARTLIRGIAIDNAHVDFKGSINVVQTGAFTDAHLEHEGLLMSKKARIDAMPGLQVDTDEVKAMHSSAIHYIRPDQIFYLESRGIDALTARKMIATGFLKEMLTTVRKPALLKEIHSFVQKKQEHIQYD